MNKQNPYQKPRRILLTIFLLASVLFSIIGLMINIKTVQLNEDIRQLKSKLKIQNEENRLLELKILDKTTLDKIEKKAKALHMKPATNPYYIDLPNASDLNPHHGSR